MHEMSTVLRLVSQALTRAEKENAASVQEVTVEIGEMTDIVPEYVHRYYPEAVRGTILEGSRLVTRTVPASIRCLDCGTEFHPSREYNYRCPSCGGIRCRILKGRDVTLASMKIESTDRDRPVSESECP